MHNKSPPKLVRKDPPYKNRIPPAPEVSLCSEVARSQVLWRVLSLNKSALSLSAVNSLCVWFHSLSAITKNQLPEPTCDRQPWQTRGDWGILIDWRRLWQLASVGPWTGKKHWLKTAETRVKSGLRLIVLVSTLTSWFWSPYCGYVRYAY